MSMIRVENITFSYPSSFDPVFENVSFQIDTEWKNLHICPNVFMFHCVHSKRTAPHCRRCRPRQSSSEYPRS